MKGKKEMLISESGIFEIQDSSKWTQKAYTFQITQADLATSPAIFIAFIPTAASTTYGALIDNVKLTPVEVKEVSFGGTNNYWELWADDSGVTNASEVAKNKIYSAPQWKDVNGDSDAADDTQKEHNYAVAYTRNTKPKIGAKIKITGASNFGAIKIKATGPGGVAIPETTATVSNDEVTLSLTETSSALVKTIKFYDKKDDAKAFKLEWEVKIGDSGWAKIGTTKHTVYVTLATPKTPLRQETLCVPSMGAVLTGFKSPV